MDSCGSREKRKINLNISGDDTYMGEDNKNSSCSDSSSSGSFDQTHNLNKSVDDTYMNYDDDDDDDDDDDKNNSSSSSSSSSSSRSNIGNSSNSNSNNYKSRVAQCEDKVKLSCFNESDPTDGPLTINC